MKKLLLPVSALLLLTSANTFAKEVGKKIYGYGALYTSYLNYNNSKYKEDGYSTTGYLSLGDGLYNTLQLGVGYTHINYKDGYSDLDQEDFTAVYSNTNQFLKNHTFSFGVHYINSDDDLTDGGYTLFFDGTYSNYSPKYPYSFRWNAGIGLYYSHYPNTVNFNVYQVTPHTTIKLFSDYEKGTLYLDLTGYYIHVTDSDELGIGNDNYYSLDGALRYYYGSYDFKIGGWVGKQMFAVKNGGFVVYNLAEKYKGGAYGEIGYTFKNGLRVSFNLSVNKYTEGSDDVTQTVGTVSIGYRF